MQKETEVNLSSSHATDSLHYHRDTITVYDMAGTKPELTTLPPEQIQNAISSGKFSFPRNVRIPVTSPDGQIGTVDSSEAAAAFRQGYSFITPENERKQEAKEWWDKKAKEVFLGRPSKDFDTQAIIDANPAFFLFGELLVAIFFHVLFAKFLSIQRNSLEEFRDVRGGRSADFALAGALTCLFLGLYSGFLHSLFLILCSTILILIWRTLAKFRFGSAISKLPYVSISMSVNIGNSKVSAQSSDAIPDKEIKGA